LLKITNIKDLNHALSMIISIFPRNSVCLLFEAANSFQAISLSFKALIHWFWIHRAPLLTN